MKKVVLILALMLTSSLAFAQDVPTSTESTAPEEEDPKFTAAVDVVYPYLWRGIKYYGDKVAFQPYVAYAFTDKFSAGLWATTNFSNAADAYNEFDWNISYQVTPIVAVMLSDYYWPATKNNPDWERSSYFDYSEGSAQSLDLSILFDFSEKGVPLDLQWNTLIGGNDYKYDDNGNRSRAFSSYAEAGYTHSFESVGIDVRPFVGAVVINGGYYGVDENDEAGFFFSNVGVNVSKDFKITEKFSLPVFVRYTYNENGNANSDGEIKHNFISGGMTFTIR
ncbi:TorF family putative porin [Flavobacterium maritimum]|jgi:hypothetical protein|uniref:TorF family putative porin n=1 Tax=Flavobacterium maritimum TaxID=3149042 RepID=UPI0032B61589